MESEAALPSGEVAPFVMAYFRDTLSEKVMAGPFAPDIAFGLAPDVPPLFPEGVWFALDAMIELVPGPLLVVPEEAGVVLEGVGNAPDDASLVPKSSPSTLEILRKDGRSLALCLVVVSDAKEDAVGDLCMTVSICLSQAEMLSLRALTLE